MVPGLRNTGVPMAETEDPTLFFNRADEIIQVANRQHATTRADRVSASTAFAAARFSVWAVCGTTSDASQIAARREQFLEGFVQGYRQMLIDNFTDHESNFETYHPVLTTPAPTSSANEG
jgi:hypothetical protein